jgi:hypothetical protein
VPGVRAALHRRLPTDARLPAAVVEVVRVLTAAVLLASALLAVAVVGGRGAAARDPASTLRAAPADDSLPAVLRAAAALERTGAPGGARGHDPADVATLVDAAVSGDRVQDLAGDLVRRGTVAGPPAGRTPPPGALDAAGPARTSPPDPGRSGGHGRQAGMTLPQWWLALKPEELAAPGDGAVTLAQAPRPALPKSWHTVGGILERVTSHAAAFADQTMAAAGEKYAPALKADPATDPERVSATASAHAKTAIEHQQKAAFAAARGELLMAVKALEDLSGIADGLAPLLLLDGLALNHAAQNGYRFVDSGRRGSGSYGEFADRPPFSAAEVARATLTAVRPLAVALEAHAGGRVGTRHKTLLAKAEAQADAVSRYETWPWRLLYRDPAAARGKALAMVNTLEQLSQLADAISYQLGMEGERLQEGAESTRAMVGEYREAVRNLGQRSSLDGPGPGTATAAVGGGDADADGAPATGDPVPTAGGDEQGADHAGSVGDEQPGDPAQGVAGNALDGAGGTDPFSNPPADGAQVTAGGDPASPLRDGDGLAGVDAGDPTYSGSLFG